VSRSPCLVAIAGILDKHAIWYWVMSIVRQIDVHNLILLVLTGAGGSFMSFLGLSTSSYIDRAVAAASLVTISFFLSLLLIVFPIEVRRFYNAGNWPCFCGGRGLPSQASNE
jgi:hypothetical protein